MRTREREGREERTEGGKQSIELRVPKPIFGSAKCKENDRPVMHRGIRRKSSNRTRGGPISSGSNPRSHYISRAPCGQGHIYYLGPSRLEQMLRGVALPSTHAAESALLRFTTRNRFPVSTKSLVPISRISRSLNSQHLCLS